MQTDWDDAFANMAHIPGADRMPAGWEVRAATFRNSRVRMNLDHPYGDAQREVFDLFHPEGASKGLAVFVHGGYWMRTDKSTWSHLAQGAVANGWTVCMPSYTLAPDASIADMTKQIGAAINAVALNIAGPIRLAGHSAGGHLVSRMICADTPLLDPVLARLEHTLSISGLHDLRPLMATQINTTLQLDDAQAFSESAALLRPHKTPHVTAWVGGHERPEFIRQSQLLAMMWQGFDADISCHIDGSHNHFSVIEGLCDPDSPITHAFAP